MELTITQRRENAILGRTEVLFRIVHPEAGTPTRAEIRKALAASLDAKDGVVVLDWARSEYGRTATRGYAKWYKTKERALQLETGPILVRNGLKAAAAKAVAPKEAPTPPKKEAAPAPKAEPKKEAPKPPAKAPAKPPAKPPAKEEAPKAEPKKEAKEAPKEKKPAAKKEGK